MAMSSPSGALPFRAADRPAPKLRPLEAVRRFRLLVADKEDTAQVFHITEALSGGHLAKRLRRALRTEEGRRAAQKQEDLIPYLDDHEGLAKLPEGSLGRAYLAFMSAEGLTARGLQAEERKVKPEVHGDLIQWYADRERDLHDVIHVLTGYSRGALGELSNLAFSYGLHRGGFGDLFIALMGAIEMKRWFPGLPLLRVIAEAVRAGRAAREFYLMDIPALFAMPLDEAKARLRIRDVPIYRRVSAAITSGETGPRAAPPYEAVASG
jgi:ubiquinone biosynthesis protein COQ4